MRVLGIDFGTSNTVAMVRGVDGRAHPLLFDASPLLPSAVYLTLDGQLIAGRDAERSARVDPARFEPNPKRRIDDGALLLADREVPVPRVIAAVLRQVAAEAHRHWGAPAEQLRLTHPARWGVRRRAVLSEAARAAGLVPPRLIAEPVAAASYYTAVLGGAVPIGRALAIYDLGGGTFDAAVVRRTGSGFDVLAEHGLGDVGGLDFDHALVEHLGRGFSTGHTQQWSELLSPADASARRHRTLLYEDARGAKEMLSRAAAADVHLPALEIHAHVTRDELERLIRPYLAQTVDCLARTIAAARLAPADLVGIFLVGGSSRIPLAAHLIHAELGVAPTTLEQPETVVAEGSLYFGGAPGATGNELGHSGVPRQTSIFPAVAAPVRQPRLTPVVASPVIGGGQSHRAVPAPTSPAVPAQPRSVGPPPAMAPALVRSWYQEPIIVSTVIVLILVIIALVVLIIVATR